MRAVSLSFVLCFIHPGHAGVQGPRNGAQDARGEGSRAPVGHGDGQRKSSKRRCGRRRSDRVLKEWSHPRPIALVYSQGEKKREKKTLQRYKVLKKKCDFVLILSVRGFKYLRCVV